jgi:hypothetical protein
LFVWYNHGGRLLPEGVSLIVLVPLLCSESLFFIPMEWPCSGGANNDRTTLSYAVKKEHKDAIRLLIYNGANIEAKDDDTGRNMGSLPERGYLTGSLS